MNLGGKTNTHNVRQYSGKCHMNSLHNDNFLDLPLKRSYQGVLAAAGTKLYNESVVHTFKKVWLWLKK